MLSCTDFLPLPPLTLPIQRRLGGGLQRPAGKRTCQAREGLLSSGLGSSHRGRGAGRTRGWRQRLQGGSPFPEPNRPHARAAGKETFPPPSLPPRQWRENWVRSSLLLLAVGGGGAALQFPPDQRAEFGEWGGWCGQGPVGSPAPPHIPDGVIRTEGPLGQHRPDTTQTCAHPGAAGTSSPEHPDSRGRGLQTPTFQALPSPLGIPNHICS